MYIKKFSFTWVLCGFLVIDRLLSERARAEEEIRGYSLVSFLGQYYSTVQEENKLFFKCIILYNVQMFDAFFKVLNFI